MSGTECSSLVSYVMGHLQYVEPSCLWRNRVIFLISLIYEASMQLHLTRNHTLLHWSRASSFIDVIFFFFNDLTSFLMYTCCQQLTSMFLLSINYFNEQSRDADWSCNVLSHRVLLILPPCPPTATWGILTHLSRGMVWTAAWKMECPFSSFWFT